MKLNSEITNKTQLTVFYDSACPLCVNEMNHLAKRDERSALSFFDIHRPDLPHLHPDVDFFAANSVLHGKLASGQLLKGLDVTYQAWRLIGRGFVIAPLRWPLIRILADKAYLAFARHRFGVSLLLTGKRRRNTCSDHCQAPQASQGGDKNG